MTFVAFLSTFAALFAFSVFFIYSCMVWFYRLCTPTSNLTTVTA